MSSFMKTGKQLTSFGKHLISVNMKRCIFLFVLSLILCTKNEYNDIDYGVHLAKWNISKQSVKYGWPKDLL